MRAVILVAAAALLPGCLAGFQGSPLTNPDPEDYAPTESGPTTAVARSGEANGVLVHVHGWRRAWPAEDARDSVPAFVIVDLSVRAAPTAAHSVAPAGLVLEGTVAGNATATTEANSVLTRFLPQAMPMHLPLARNVTFRGDVLFVAQEDFEPTGLRYVGARIVDFASEPAPPPEVAPARARLAVGAGAESGGVRVEVRELAAASGHPYHEGFALLGLNFTYSAERVEDARGLTMQFLLRGAGGRLYRPSESETPEWWDGASGREFAPGRAYEERVLLEAPADAAPYEAWFVPPDGAPIAWGPIEPVTGAA